MVWVTWPVFVTSFIVGETGDSRESLNRFPAWIMKSMTPLGFLGLAAQGAAEALRCLAFPGTVTTQQVQVRAIEQEIEDALRPLPPSPYRSRNFLNLRRI